MKYFIDSAIAFPGLERRHSTISTDLLVGHPKISATSLVFLATFSV